jgi:cytochrome c-type biogenesis protein CcmE
VIYRGVLPDLFREGQSVIAKGRIEGDVFIADEVLAKHDETYMPAEVADKMTQARMARAQKLKDEAEALKLQGDVPGNQATAADSRDSGAP